MKKILNIGPMGFRDAPDKTGGIVVFYQEWLEYCDGAGVEYCSIDTNKSNYANKIAVVFGLGPAGLFLARQLKLLGYKAYGIGKVDDIGKYSNVLEQYWEAEDKQAVVAAVSGIVKQYGKGVEAWICSDQYLTLFIEECSEVFSLLDFSKPGERILRLIADKKALMAYCAKIGVHFPERYTINDIDSIEYPVVVKPNIKHGSSPIKKINFADSMNELQTLLDYAKANQLSDEQLIIQKSVAGNNGAEYGYGGYFRDGKAINDVYFLQARQYPQGVCCYTIELTDENIKLEIAEQVQRLITELKYTGFLQFDLKKDSNTGKLYVLDINPRPWGSVSMLSRKCGAKSVFEPNPELSTKECWRFPLKELMAFSNKNNVAYAECRRLKRFGHYKTTLDLWDRHDMKPFFMQPVITFMKLIKRVQA